MAMFRKGDSFGDLAEKLKIPARLDPAELAEVIASITTHPEASPHKLAFMMDSPHPTIRAAGIRHVAENARRDAMDVVIQAIAMLDGPARGNLAKTAFELDRSELIRCASTMFNSSNIQIRMAVLELSSLDSGWRDWFGIMKLALRTTEPPLRRAAARLIRRSVQDPVAGAALRELLHDDDTAVRSEAIQAFCDYPSPEIVEAFFARLPHESPVDQTRMLQALARLSSRPNSNIEQHLFPVLADDDADARRLAVRLVSSMPAPDEMLRKFLVHCRGLASWLRERAVHSILEMSGALCGPLLKLMQDDDEDVRVAAMGLAAKIKDERILQPVVQIFRSNSDWWVRSIAVEVLANFPCDETLELLLPFLHDADMRFSIVSAFARIERPETTAHLIESLKDPARSIREIALDGLANRVSQEVIECVVISAKHDPDSALRAKALEILRGFGPIAAARLGALQVELRLANDAEDPAKRETSIASVQLEMENPALNRERA